MYMRRVYVSLLLSNGYLFSNSNDVSLHSGH